jgi:hypothetical protein
MEMCRHTGHPARQNLAAFSHELLEQIRILVVDGFCGNIDATAWHDPVGPSEIRPALGIFRFHYLLHLPMKGAPAQKRIVFFLLQPARCIEAFFVTGAHVT